MLWDQVGDSIKGALWTNPLPLTFKSKLRLSWHPQRSPWMQYPPTPGTLPLQGAFFHNAMLLYTTGLLLNPGPTKPFWFILSWGKPEFSKLTDWLVYLWVNPHKPRQEDTNIKYLILSNICISRAVRICCLSLVEEGAKHLRQETLESGTANYW
jgi:hypothetical protein